MLELTRTAVIGQGDTVIFRYILDIDIDSDGRIYVVDMDNPGARVFSPDGEFLLQIVQRRGEGPGELPGTYKIAVDRGLIYFSSPNRTLEIFETGEGRYLGSIPHPGIPIAEEVVPTQDGVAVLYYATDNSEGPFPLNNVGRVAIIGLDSTITDTGTELGVGRVPHYNYGFAWGPAPLVPATEIHIGTDGKVYFTERGDPVIRVVGGDSLSWGIARLPANRSDRKWALNERMELYDLAKATANIPELADREAKAPSALPVTRWWPVLRDFVVSQDRMLVQRLDLQKRSPETVWDLLVNEREVLGRVTFPAGFEPHAIRGDIVAGVSQNDLGVEAVVVYRIMTPFAQRSQ